MTNIGQLIKEERIRQGLSAGELANKSGVNRTRLSRAENGHEKPSLKTLILLGEALNTTFTNQEYLNFLNCEEKKSIEVLLKKYQHKNRLSVDIPSEIMGTIENYEIVREEIELAIVDILETYIKHYRR